MCNVEQQGLSNAKNQSNWNLIFKHFYFSAMSRMKIERNPVKGKGQVIFNDRVRTNRVMLYFQNSLCVLGYFKM
jgi:hypothetical protein